MSTISNYFGNMVLSYYMNNVNRWVGLMTGDPTVTFNASVEVTGGSYARQYSGWSTAANRSVSNTTTLIFDNMPACTVSYLGIFDGNSGANLWFYSPLASPIVVPASARITIPVNEIVITLN